MRAIIAVAAALTSMTSAHAGPFYCSTWQGIRTCSSPDGYLSREWDRDGMTFGDDNRGDHWTTSRWQGFTTTTVTPPARR